VFELVSRPAAEAPDPSARSILRYLRGDGKDGEVGEVPIRDRHSPAATAGRIHRLDDALLYGCGVPRGDRSQGSRSFTVPARGA